MLGVSFKTYGQFVFEDTGMKRVKAVQVLDKPYGWDVRYVLREKGERYRAALFDKSIKTREDVEQWVRDQDHLVLLP